jgi:hypothetical protein
MLAEEKFGLFEFSKDATQATFKNLRGNVYEIMACDIELEVSDVHFDGKGKMKLAFTKEPQNAFLHIGLDQKFFLRIYDHKRDPDTKERENYEFKDYDVPDDDLQGFLFNAKIVDKHVELYEDKKTLDFSRKVLGKNGS